MNDMENLRTFADQLWKYMVPKLDSKFASNVSYFRAQVVSNLGNNKLEVQRPMENGTLTLPCVRAMSNAQPGQQVVALVMGSMSNAIVVGDGNLNVPGGSGDAGIANFQAQSDGSLVITLINGNTLTATPHDPTKQDVLTFDDVPTQGSNNPVKSGGVYTALDNKVDKVAGKGLSANDFTNALKDKLDGIDAGAEVNQNAFSNVVVGSVTVSADSKQDTLTLNAGGLVNITGDATNDSVTISVDPNHTHITTQVLDLVNADSYGPSGMVSFDADVAEVPLKNCIVNIEPVQAGSGTPSPTNVRAISGWTGANVTRAGKNFADCSKAESGTNAGITYSVIKNEEGSVEKIVANGTITGRTAFYIIRTATGFPAGNYIFTAGSNVTSNGIRLVVMRTRNGADVYRDVTSGNDYSLDIQPTDEIRLYLRGETSGTVVNNVEIYPMMRLASETDRTFEPYQGQTIDISFPSEAGTVYGGTLDVTSGVLTVSMARYLLGQSAEDWRWDRSNNYYYLANTETILAGRKRAGSLLCSIAVKYPATTVAEFRDAPAWNILFVGNMNIRPDEEVGALGTGAKFREWLASREEAVEVVYELEAPITYQLSPQIISTLLGSNSIWDDCGTISIDYGAFLSALDKAIEEHSGDDIRHITEAEREAWDGKQDTLTFDDVPTAGSSNPVTSEGIKTALDEKADSSHTHDGLYYKLTNGTEIPSGADLNDATYRTPGNYICQWDTDARNVKHTPGFDATTLVNTKASAFKLFVGYAQGGNNYIAQEYRDYYTGTVYYRWWDNSNWIAWRAVRGTASILIRELGTATASITDSTLISTSDAYGETGTWYRRAATAFWNYVKGKADAVYAAISHTHDASDITSGILPAARGGTGNGNGYIQIGQESGTTLGSYATAEGNRTTASGGPAAHAEGEYTSATGNDAPHAEGYYTKASGDYAAHAEGYWTTASGQYGSHAEGMNTVASGNNGSHAEGHNTVASGDYGAHAEGDHTIAAGRSQHVFGAYNVSNTTDVEIVGWGAINARKNIRTLSNTGNEWIAGTLTQASDARLKDVQGSIPDLSSIRAVRFRWKNGDDKEHLGYLAQDVEEIAPYLVDVDSNGYKSLDYIALLTAKVEMLEQEIEKLKAGLYS
jgi:hypothetical protein